VSIDAFPARLLRKERNLKKKKRKSSRTPKKAARKAASGARKTVKKRTTKKPQRKKPSTAKKRSKAPSTAGKTAKRTANGNGPSICTENFTASNNSQVCFSDIPDGGCTLSQISGDVYPFSPVTGTDNGLDYTNLTQDDNCVYVVVPVLNRTYPYDVSCCEDSKADPGHSVTVNS
jgi:hypothetical protein